MIEKRPTIRSLKKTVNDILRSPDFDPEQLRFPGVSSRQVINALFPFLYDQDPVVKLNAITAMGGVVSDLAEQNMEAARVIVRRLMWNLNDESGGIGWGSPEAMGEILAEQDSLAREYSSILLSYTREDGNFQEHPLMQRGVLWGIARLCQARPYILTEDAWPHIRPFLDSRDPTVRGLAARILGLLGAKQTRPCLEKLQSDETPLELWEDHTFVNYRVKDLALEALQRPGMGV